MKMPKFLHEITKLNDMRFRGFLSYRGVRVIAWFAIVLSQVAVVLGLMAQQFSPVNHDIMALKRSSDVLSIIGEVALPLFLVANFGRIFSSRNNIKKLMLTHLIIALGIYVGFVVFYFRYVIDVTNYFKLDQGSVDQLIALMLQNFLTFNVFIDLFMCSSLYFFLIYRPKKVFVGKKLTIFRLFALLPIFYEIVCIVLKGLSMGQGLFILPVIIMPLMTSKPTVTFLAFVTILLIMKYRQYHYVKHGGTLEGYEEFALTNTNSFHFSIIVAVIFAIASVVDLIGTSILLGIFNSSNVDYFVLFPDQAYTDFIIWAKAWGFGKGMSLILASPLMIFYSYTKEHSDKSKIVDIIIPLVGIALCFLVFLEGTRDLILFR